MYAVIPSYTIARIASLGLTETQASVVALMLSEVEAATEEKAMEAIEARRANDRERKARQRHESSRDVTGQNGTARTNPEPPPSRAPAFSTGEEVVIPLSEATPLRTPSAKKADATRGHRLPDGWEPKSEARNEWISDGLPVAKFDFVVSEFKNYWWSASGAKARRINWDMVFINRMREQAERFRARAGPINGHSAKPSTLSALHRMSNGKQNPDDGFDFEQQTSGHDGPTLDLDAVEVPERH